MIWRIIKIGMVRAGIENVLELSQMTGIKYSTLAHTRRANPDSFRLYELSAIDNVIHFTSEEWAALREAT